MYRERDLKFLVIAVLDDSSVPLKAKIIASIIRQDYGVECNKNSINRLLYADLKWHFIKTSDYSWYTNHKNMIPEIEAALTNVEEPLLMNEVILNTNFNRVPRAYFELVMKTMTTLGILKKVNGIKFLKVNDTKYIKKDSISLEKTKAISRKYNLNSSRQDLNDNKESSNNTNGGIVNRFINAIKKKNVEQNITDLTSKVDNQNKEKKLEFDENSLDETIREVFYSEPPNLSNELKKLGITLSILRIRAGELCAGTKISANWINSSSRVKLVKFICDQYDIKNFNKKEERRASNKKIKTNDEIWIYEYADLDNNALFSVKPFSNKTKIIFNAGHPSFDVFKNIFLNEELKLNELNESELLLKVIIHSWAKYEVDIPEGILYENAIDYRMDIGRYVKKMLNN